MTEKLARMKDENELLLAELWMTRAALKLVAINEHMRDGARGCSTCRATMDAVDSALADTEYRFALKSGRGE